MNEINEEFEKLEKQYGRFIHHMAAQYFIPLHDKDDKYNIGLAEMYKATQNYDSSKGVKFISYLGMCLKARYLTLKRESEQLKRCANTNAHSMDYVYDYNGENTTYLDILTYEQDEVANLTKHIERVKIKINEADRLLLDLKLNAPEMTQGELSKLMPNDNQTYVSRRLKRIKNVLKEELELNRII